jgi:putative sterol carrier protein
MEAANAALQESAGFQSSIAGKNLGVQFVVSDGADGGQLDYYMSIADGAATLAKGELEGADVTVTSNYETAAGIAKGDLNTQMAFMTGKIKVGGNLAVLMTHQNIVSQWGAATAAMDVEY